MLRESLRGLTVVDFTQIGAGPTCTMFLSDLGANVIKIEPPGGDTGRKLGPPWYRGYSPVFVAFNRGKRSICINLKSEQGRAVAFDLAARADVVVESFRPGVMDRLGLGYGALKAKDERLIYCSISAYGQSGPYAGRAGVDGILQAASGLMELIGSEGTEPCKVQAPIVDVTTGYIGTIGVLAALADRERTGQGAHLDVSLFASAVALQQSAITTFLGEGKQPDKIGSAAPYSAPNEAFQANDGWIMLAAYTRDLWPRLCRILGLDDLAEDPRFATSSDRVLNRHEMRKLLAPAFRRESCAYWLERLEANDILSIKVADYNDLLRNPQLDHLGMIAEARHAAGGTFRMPAFPINSAEQSPAKAASLPDLGEHTREILEESGYSAGQIDAFLSCGVVA